MQRGNYSASSRSRRRKIAPFFVTHLGCPWNCSFCDQEVIEGVSPAIEDSMEKFEEFIVGMKTPPDQIAFYGGDILSLPAHSIEDLVGRAYSVVERHFGRKVPLRVSATPRAIDENSLNLARKIGIRTIEIGVVSTDEEILKSANRGESRESIVRAVNLSMEIGFETGVQFVTGLPGETLSLFSRTLTDILSLRPHFARLYPLIIIEGTPLGDSFVKGIFDPKEDSYFVSAAALFIAHCARWGVAVARVGLQKRARSEGRILHEPSVKNLRQEGEGEFALYVVERIFEIFGNEVQIHFPQRYETSLRGRGSERLKRLSSRLDNLEESIRFSKEEGTLRVFTRNGGGGMLFHLSLFSWGFTCKILASEEGT